MWKIFLISFLINGYLSPLLASVTDGLVASYTFNEGSTTDDVKGMQAIMSFTHQSKDRFGNTKHAVYLQGTNASYIILGNSDVLKPTSGTVSLWVKIENPIFNGRGVMANPIIITKSNPTDDFYEGYSLFYDIGSKKLGAVTSLDEPNQAGCRTVDEIDLHTWYHISMTYDDESLKLYINGELAAAISKKFTTQFLDNDPVVIGSFLNSKNERYLNGYIDDVKIYNRVLSDKEILELYNAPNPVRWKVFFRYLLYALLGTLLLTGIIFFVRMRIKYVLKKEQEKTMLTKKSQEQEIRILKAKMDPHFIFNSLNSIQQLILTNENEKAQSYLTKFSRLLRKSIESNTYDSISLFDEIDILKKYIEMESLRFETAIETEVSVDDNIDIKQMSIPPMLLQPIVENAIWHGLLPKNGGEKKIELRFSLANEKTLTCIIEDNGIGLNSSRKKEKGKENKSFALQFIRQRLELMSEIYKQNYSITIEDASQTGYRNSGTIVTLKLPILKKEYAQSNYH